MQRLIDTSPDTPPSLERMMHSPGGMGNAGIVEKTNQIHEI